jgi:hypothetical protein
MIQCSIYTHVHPKALSLGPDLANINKIYSRTCMSNNISERALVRDATRTGLSIAQQSRRWPHIKTFNRIFPLVPLLYPIHHTILSTVSYTYRDPIGFDPKSIRQRYFIIIFITILVTLIVFYFSVQCTNAVRIGPVQNLGQK